MARKAKEVKLVTRGEKGRFQSVVCPGLREAAEAKGMDYMTLYMRVRKGMSLDKALTKPVRAYNKRANVQLELPF